MILMFYLINRLDLRLCGVPTRVGAGLLAVLLRLYAGIGALILCSAITALARVKPVLSRSTADLGDCRGVTVHFIAPPTGSS